jgi:hypothetical protein
MTTYVCGLSVYLWHSDDFRDSIGALQVLVAVGKFGGPWAIQTVPPLIVRIKLK